MPPTPNMMPAIRACAFRPRAARPHNAVIGVKRPADRAYAADQQKKAAFPEQGAAGPNMNQQEHVSEEAAKMAEVQGKEGPDIEGQGTPVQEILQEDKEARQQAPKVMKEQAKAGQTTKPSTGTRSFSTSARRRVDMDVPSSSGVPLPPSMIPSESQRADYASSLQQATASLTIPPPKNLAETVPETITHREKRYPEIVEQLTNLLMRDGKKSVAQRHMAVILSTLRTSPAPTYSPTRSLLPGHPPANHLPLNPIIYLTLAVESVAPLLRLRSQRGAAGGGVALQIPVPLNLRQRRRQAFMWILDAVEKKQNRGSGRDTFPHRVAQELISVVEGKSGIWTKRDAVHKLATTARSNLSYFTRRR